MPQYTSTKSNTLHQTCPTMNALTYADGNRQDIATTEPVIKADTPVNKTHAQ